MDLFSSFFTRTPGPWPKSRVVIDPREKTTEEITLEQSGDFNTLQRFRYLVYSRTKRARPTEIDHLLATEQKLRHYTQLLSREYDNGSEETKSRLEQINRKIWELHRQWWNYQCQIGEGVTARAFNLWRSHPTWYMHEVLVEDCIEKQGCCSRGCGCCPKRHLTHRLAAGHCALTCECCRKARGFDLTQEQETLVYDTLDFQQEKNFANRFQLASIWGLRLNNDQSPSDLIKSGYKLAGKDGADEKWDIVSSATKDLIPLGD